MAILIVDDETSTRNALRELLTQLGHKTILEARNGEEGLKIADSDRSRIRAIVADWEMPYMDGIRMMERIAEIPELDLAPFLLITSDLPRSKLNELQSRTTRLDAFLIKPFRMKALSLAVGQAQKHRASVRSAVLVLGASDSLSRKLDEAWAKLPGGMWDPPVKVATAAELKLAAAAHARRLGAIIVDPGEPGSSLASGAAEWLATFARTPLGASTPVICASREAACVFPLRTLCREFAGPDADWVELMSRQRAHEGASLDLELMFQELKALQQAREPADALKLCERILKLDPGNAEAHCALGDLSAAKGAPHYRSALALNPCLPKPYIRLLELEPPGSPELARAAADAAAYCPQNADVLHAAARAWLAAGRAEPAHELARRILALNPGHEGARALLGGAAGP